MRFYHVLCPEVQPTQPTTAFLPFQQVEHPCRFRRIASSALNPVRPVPIIRTFIAPDFDVSLDWRVGVLDQPRCSVTKVLAIAALFPVAIDAPPTSFAWVSKPRPPV